MMPLETLAGPILNAAGILIGGIAGCLGKSTLPPALQKTIKSWIGLSLVGFGLYLVWTQLPPGFGKSLRMLFIVLVSLSLGKKLGESLGLQQTSNRLGQTASRLMEQINSSQSTRFSDGLITCTILFCVAPLALLGSIQGGLTQGVSALTIKGLVDGLAMMAFAGLFGASVLTAVVPVLAVEGTLTLILRTSQPWLAQHDLISPIMVTTGFLMTFVAVLVFEVKKVAVTDYLPALAVAPALHFLIARFIG